MQLQVLGNPTYTSPTKVAQQVIVTYNPNKDYTVVSCDVDIVTLGLAINVLMLEYEKALGKLESSVAEQIRDTTRKVAVAYEKY